MKEINIGYHIANLVLRIAGGGFMLTHGIPKLQKILSGDMGFADPFGIGSGPSLMLTVFAEVLCAVLLLLGLGTRWAAIPLFITMAVAAFMIHGADPFGKKELALLYGAIYLALALMGGGKFSLDNVFFGKNRKETKVV